MYNTSILAFDANPGDSQVAVLNGILVIASETVVALHADTGTLLWSVNVSGTVSLLLERHRVRWRDPSRQ